MEISYVLIYYSDKEKEYDNYAHSALVDVTEFFPKRYNELQ